MITIGQSQQIFSAAFSVDDDEEVVLSGIPGAENLVVRIVFDPVLPEGQTEPQIDWKGGEGKDTWTGTEKNSILITCRGWKGFGSTNVAGRLATLAHQVKSEELPQPLSATHALTFKLFDARVKATHNVSFQLYLERLSG